MDINTINGIIRAIVPALCAYLVGKGYISAGSVGDITAAIVAVAAALWSIKSNKVTTS